MGRSLNIVGPQEVAEMLEVKLQTVHAWRLRKVLPEPSEVISGVPIWRRPAIQRWAVRTKRVKIEESQ